MQIILFLTMIVGAIAFRPFSKIAGSRAFTKWVWCKSSQLVGNVSFCTIFNIRTIAQIWIMDPDLTFLYHVILLFAGRPSQWRIHLCSSTSRSLAKLRVASRSSFMRTLSQRPPRTSAPSAQERPESATSHPSSTEWLRTLCARAVTSPEETALAVSVSTDVSIPSTIKSIFEILQGAVLLLPILNLGFQFLQFSGREVLKHLFDFLRVTHFSENANLLHIHNTHS